MLPVWRRVDPDSDEMLAIQRCRWPVLVQAGTGVR